LWRFEKLPIGSGFTGDLERKPRQWRNAPDRETAQGNPEPQKKARPQYKYYAVGFGWLLVLGCPRTSARALRDWLLPSNALINCPCFFCVAGLFL
jgi:hypothetical protein